MGRLIDTDSLKDRASEYTLNNDEYRRFCEIINAESTAYDPDKVVEQLEKEFKKYYGENWNKAPYLVKTIEIVKGGGVDGN